LVSRPVLRLHGRINVIVGVNLSNQFWPLTMNWHS